MCWDNKEWEVELEVIRWHRAVKVDCQIKRRWVDSLRKELRIENFLSWIQRKALKSIWGIESEQELDRRVQGRRWREVIVWEVSWISGSRIQRKRTWKERAGRATELSKIIVESILE
jgi:hypothetical protein